MSTRKIRFTRNCGAYNDGEVAGFVEASAAEYVKRGLAQYFTTEVSTTPVTKERAPPPKSDGEKIFEELGAPSEDGKNGEDSEKPKKRLLRRRSRRRSEED